jgi:ATP-dependent helicase HepA
VVRLLVTPPGEDLADKYDVAQLQVLPVDLGKQTISQIISSQQEVIRRMLHQTEKHTARRLSVLITQATDKMETELEQELQRLTALQRVNPNVRQDEIDALREKMQQLRHHLHTARLHQDAVRLIIAA